MNISKRMVAALAAAAVGGPLAVTLAQADDPPPVAPPASTVPVPATAEQKAAFAVLDRSASLADAANGIVTALADAAQRGFDAAGARVVGSSAVGPVWLVPANGALCLVLQDTGDGSAGGACEPSENVIARGITVGDGATVYGLAPDGVSTVAVTDDTATTTTVTVSGGFYRLAPGHQTVTVGGPGGPTTFDVDGAGA